RHSADRRVYAALGAGAEDDAEADGVEPEPQAGNGRAFPNADAITHGDRRRIAEAQAHLGQGGRLRASAWLERGADRARDAGRGRSGLPRGALPGADRAAVAPSRRATSAERIALVRAGSGRAARVLRACVPAVVAASGRGRRGRRCPTGPALVS